MKLVSNGGDNNHIKPAAKRKKPAPAEPSAAKRRTQSRAERGGKKNSSGRGRTAAIIAASAAAVLILLCAVGVVLVNRTTAVFPNVTLDGMPVGGMTELELSQKLVDSGYGSIGSEAVTVELPLGNTLTLRAADVCTKTDISDVVDSVMDACRGGSGVKNALTYLRCRFGGMALESGVGLSVDESAVRAAVENMAAQVQRELRGSEIQVGETSIRVVKGASAVTIDVQELTSLIVEAFRSQSYGTIKYEARVEQDEAPDIDALYDSVCGEAQDAYYDSENDTIVDEKVGMSFDKTQARRLWDAASYGETVEIPVEVTQPKVTAVQLREVLFRDCFCTKGTSLVGSSANRVNNVTLAAAAINGIVLMPGEEFSYNDALGERTAERGYLPAGAYSAGQTVQEYGGGICQVSSTLYYCALYANLKITARTCHMFPVGYLPAGLDATVSWGGPEFKFVNDREYPVKIVSYVKDNELYVEIWGTDTDGSYVEMNYSTSIMYDSKYTDVAIGYKATTYRSVYDKNGNLISKEIEARSTYNYHKEDIKWPEESPEVTQPPAATPSPEETQTPTETETPPSFTGDPTVPPPEDTTPTEPDSPVGE